MRTMTSTLALLATAAFLPTPGVAQQSNLAVQEWEVPWERSRPRDPFVAPDGKVWFVGQVGNYIANLDPRSGEFTRMIWYGSDLNTIGRVPVPARAARLVP